MLFRLRQGVFLALSVDRLFTFEPGLHSFLCPFLKHKNGAGEIGHHRQCLGRHLVQESPSRVCFQWSASSFIGTSCTIGQPYMPSREKAIQSYHLQGEEKAAHPASFGPLFRQEETTQPNLCWPAWDARWLSTGSTWITRPSFTQTDYHIQLWGLHVDKVASSLWWSHVAQLGQYLSSGRKRGLIYQFFFKDCCSACCDFNPVCVTSHFINAICKSLWAPKTRESLKPVPTPLLCNYYAKPKPFLSRYQGRFLTRNMGNWTVKNLRDSLLGGLLIGHHIKRGAIQNKAI